MNAPGDEVVLASFPSLLDKLLRADEDRVERDVLDV
jgi:hypothetical protein